MIEEKVLEEVVADFRSPWTTDCWWHHTAVMVCLMHAAGWKDTDYETLNVESGQGLSFGYKRNTCWHIDSLVGSAPERIAAATGFLLEWFVSDELEKVWAWVKNSIDQGMPIASQYGQWYAVVGYREGDVADDRQWYVLANEPISDYSGAWLTWEQIVQFDSDMPHSRYRCRYGGRTERRSPKDVAEQVMRWIVEWSTNHPGKGQKDMLWADSAYGLEAIEAYARDLGDMSLTEEGDFDYGNNGGHTTAPQWKSRRFIASYLAQKVGLFESARSSIEAAAAHYRDAHAAWVVFDEHLGQPIGGRGPGDWTDEGTRKRGSAAVYEALEHEKAGIDSLREALKVIQS